MGSNSLRQSYYLANAMAGIVILDAFCTCAEVKTWSQMEPENLELPESSFHRYIYVWAFKDLTSHVKDWKRAKKVQHWNRHGFLEDPNEFSGFIAALCCIRWKLAATQLGPLAVAKVQILMPGPQNILHLGLSRALLMSAWGCTLLKRWLSCVSRLCSAMAEWFRSIIYPAGWYAFLHVGWLAAINKQDIWVVA